MSSAWQQHINALGGKMDAAGNISFHAPLDEIKLVANNDGLALLSHYTILDISGADAQNFLQGQFSNDVATLHTNDAQQNSYCSPKGRVLAQFRLIQRADNHYQMLLPRSISDSIMKRLRMFVLRAQVTIEEAPQLVCLGFSGESIEAHLRNTFAQLPEDVNAGICERELLLLRITRQPSRFILIARQEALLAQWPTLSANLTLFGQHGWQWQDIHAGLPVIHSETADEFVPQMLNLQTLQGISFSKGCYPGQEIVARTHYLGKLKRRMYRLHTDTGDIPNNGTDIYDSNGDAQSVGKVVVAEPNPEQGVDLLAVLKISAEQGQLHLQNPDGPLLTVQNLPYSVELETTAGQRPKT